MIQDISPHQYDVTYHNTEVKEDDIVLIFQEDKILCNIKDDQIIYPSVKDIIEFNSILKGGMRFLFKIDKISYFEIQQNVIPEFLHWKYIIKEQLRNIRPSWKAFAGITGYQIHKWYLEHQFCGCCGTKMRLHEKERAMQCLNCGRVEYPQICPSVIVGITNGNHILMTKYAKDHSSYQKYALVAGYAEVGESLEDTVRREVWEEVGIRVKNIRYYKSQPWSFTDALLVGFFCEADGDSEIHMDQEELSEAKWFDRNHLPREHSESSISLTGEMIEVFKKGLEKV